MMITAIIDSHQPDTKSSKFISCRLCQKFVTFVAQFWIAKFFWEIGHFLKARHPFAVGPVDHLVGTELRLPRFFQHGGNLVLVESDDGWLGSRHGAGVMEKLRRLKEKAG